MKVSFLTNEEQTQRLLQRPKLINQLPQRQWYDYNLSIDSE